MVDETKNIPSDGCVPLASAIEALRRQILSTRQLRIAGGRDQLQIAAGQELLRQHNEISKHNRLEHARWNRLRRLMCYSSIVLLFEISAVSTYILLRRSEFPNAVLTYASAALFGDSLALVAMVWRIVLNPKFAPKLTPVLDIKEIVGDAPESRTDSPLENSTTSSRPPEKLDEGPNEAG